VPTGRRGLARLFDKSVNELTVSEPLPAALRRRRRRCIRAQRDRAIERRNYVIDRLLEMAGSAGRCGQVRKDPLSVTSPPMPPIFLPANILPRKFAAIFRAVRREEALRRRPVGPRHARSKDPGHGAQTMAAASSITTSAGLARPLSKLDINRRLGRELADVKSLSDISPWRMPWCWRPASIGGIGFQPGHELGGPSASSGKPESSRSRA